MVQENASHAIQDSFQTLMANVSLQLRTLAQPDKFHQTEFVLQFKTKLPIVSNTM